jgi:isoquinoline 1-oxidoreductase beta subunit
MVQAEGAAQLGVAVEAVTAEAGFVFVNADPARRRSYGEIIMARQSEWVLPEQSPLLKSVAQFRYTGQSVLRIDLPAKVTGCAIYGFDARLPGMLYGAVARPPRYGATLVRAAAGAAERQPGVIAVVLEDNFAAIVAESRRQAYAALAHLELSWEGGSTINQAELEGMVTAAGDDGVVVQRSGNVAEQWHTGTKIEASYRVPLAAHAHLEPRAALVHASADEIIVYVSTQAPGLVRQRVAAQLGIEQEQVQVIPLYLGGGFGGKMGIDAATEATRLSAAVGRPVHIGWNRTEEIRHGYLRPLAHSALRATISDDGQIVALEQRIASGDIFFGQGNLPLEPVVATLLGADPLALTTIFYKIPNLELLYHRRRLPVPTGSWRGLGTLPNVFAVESFMDEIALLSGKDPLELRMAHLPDGALGKRMRAVLQQVAEAAHWGKTVPAGQGRGIALGDYNGTVVALVAQVSVEGEQIHIHDIWGVADPGLVVNPNGAEAQAQGTILMAISSVLYEQLTLEQGMVTATNFDAYPLITQRQTPRIHMQLISSNDAPLGGMGEPLIGVTPAAIANAVYAATGRRLRHLPLILSDKR